jgi:hypothetical protein
MQKANRAFQRNKTRNLRDKQRGDLGLGALAFNVCTARLSAHSTRPVGSDGAGQGFSSKTAEGF